MSNVTVMSRSCMLCGMRGIAGGMWVNLLFPPRYSQSTLNIEGSLLNGLTGPRGISWKPAVSD